MTGSLRINRKKTDDGRYIEASFVHGRDAKRVSLHWIASGSFADVYCFNDNGLPKALKVLKDGVDSAKTKLFEYEYDIISQIVSENVISVYDYYSEEDAFSLEFLETNLSDYFNGGYEEPADYYHRFRLLEMIFNGVRDIHSAGIFHRDLSPSNVLITLQGDSPLVKIADFGISKYMDSSYGFELDKIPGSFNDTKNLTKVGFDNYNMKHELYSLTLLSLFVLYMKNYKGFDLEQIPNEKIRGVAVKGLNDDIDRRYLSVDELWNDLKDLPPVKY